jgi:hypothetical protein
MAAQTRASNERIQEKLKGIKPSKMQRFFASIFNDPGN